MYITPRLFIVMDYNGYIDETEIRKKQFLSWLVRAWEYASDSCLEAAEIIAELIGHAEEPDYPLWSVAELKGVIGPGPLGALLRQQCGNYPDGPRPTDWERFINYSPVIQLDEETWRHIHGQLGWPNRDHDHNMRSQNFYLWSNGGNIVRFVVRRPMEGLNDV